MGEIFENTNRRTLLQKGFLFLAGALGLKLVEKKALAQPAAPRVQTLRFYTHPRPLPNSAGPDSGPARPSRLMSWGELREVPKGPKAGEYYSTSLCLGGHLELGDPPAASTLEIQTLKIKDGTLFGLAAPEGGIEGSIHAILGGTGRYAGARGQFSALPADNAADRRTHEIVVTLLS